MNTTTNILEFMRVDKSKLDMVQRYKGDCSIMAFRLAAFDLEWNELWKIVKQAYLDCGEANMLYLKGTPKSVVEKVAKKLGYKKLDLTEYKYWTANGSLSYGSVRNICNKIQFDSAIISTSSHTTFVQDGALLDIADTRSYRVISVYAKNE